MERKREILIEYNKKLGKTENLLLLQLLHLMLDYYFVF